MTDTGPGGDPIAASDARMMAMCVTPHHDGSEALAHSLDVALTDDRTDEFKRAVSRALADTGDLAGDLARDARERL